ncbi:hypothetical protein [Cytobacillus oceanisediminis]|uniref:hypothetical protein n=1 Tax=Cytobacillus oceanisediminis TaxID=665099 RepID=UPI0024955681|nr:hypothetical protein [Cytobacillus oceanisediminis]
MTKNYLSTTALSKECNKPVKEVFDLLTKKKFIKRVNDIWVLTEKGKQCGGIQRNHAVHGGYIAWKRELILKEVENLQEAAPKERTDDGIESGFRGKFMPTHRTADGHYVRSRAETLIDNWLYMSGIVHAYERKLPIEEEAYCDFYLPKEKIYIEYWGLENDESYLERKKAKLDLYSKYGFRLIELNDKDITNLDDTLPSKLLKFNHQVS